jgi:hypothetical protein
MNISFVLLGLLLSLFLAHALLHRHYEYFDRGERGWVSYFAYLLLGVLIFLTGAIGLVRAARRKQSIRSRFDMLAGD